VTTFPQISPNHGLWYLRRIIFHHTFHTRCSETLHFPFCFAIPNAGVFGHALGSGLKAGPVVAAACEYGCGQWDSVSCFVGPQCKSSSNRFRQWSWFKYLYKHKSYIYIYLYCSFIHIYIIYLYLPVYINIYLYIYIHFFLDVKNEQNQICFF
jgi:hypothetical protein